MANSPCCRSCQHCSLAAGSKGWCRLRRLEVHSELSDLVVCHHWTPRTPKLPVLQSTGVAECQLELDRSFT
ncbi:hypothetical protein [Synechococcus sp. PROS-U-1]|uniref:hypothetical protein n=1 Tax=Synechococcus sp. PROS-U-1 TaxID=1400866 RepID=UPI001647F81F|nr:hypothetical protein [Synechococcus sp. PROS-U-1]QNJ04640.1 hypothetical protein SynPROSU1_03060 [Synechococcus sp. PROS-U-1]